MQVSSQLPAEQLTPLGVRFGQQGVGKILQAQKSSPISLVIHPLA